MDVLKEREIHRELLGLHRGGRGRIVVLTGARQTGKSTLARVALPDYPVVNLDSPVEREAYQRLAPSEWIVRFPQAVIDEAQKLPDVFETVKACYDRDPQVRYVLLGSSHVLMMRRVKESLAGRAALRELFPFTLPELNAGGAPAEPKESPLIQILRAADPARAAYDLLPPDLLAKEAFGQTREHWRTFLRFGGMPPVWNSEWSDDDRVEWLHDYHATYLQRDLLDLARLDRLEPFVRAQRAAALRSGQPINFSELARLADVSPPTARQFMLYLEISYQIVWLPGWFKNREKRLMKRACLHFLDPGILRAVAGRRGDPDGAQYESAVVAEVFKQVRNRRLPVELHHLRTADGREVDLLVERDDGYIAVECKLGHRAHRADFKHLIALDEILDRPLLLALVASEDPSPRSFPELGQRFMAVPSAALLA